MLKLWIIQFYRKMTKSQKIWSFMLIRPLKSLINGT